MIGQVLCSFAVFKQYLLIIIICRCDRDWSIWYCNEGEAWRRPVWGES